MNIIISTNYAGTAPFTPGIVDGHSVTVKQRDSDWGFTGSKKHLHYIRQAFRILKEAKQFDALVLCTVGIEAFLVARLRPLFCRTTRLICFDLLMPRPGRLMDRTQSWLHRADVFACIRRGDIATLENRFKAPNEKCHFVSFPAPSDIAPEVSEEDYIYSAGSAHRDWPLLCQALADLPYKAILIDKSF